jgi:hypothetical protein
VKPVTSKALGPPLGMYSHGMVAPGGEIVVVAGQVGMDRAGRLKDFCAHLAEMRAWSVPATSRPRPSEPSRTSGPCSRRPARP